MFNLLMVRQRLELHKTAVKIYCWTMGFSRVKTGLVFPGDRVISPLWWALFKLILSPEESGLEGGCWQNNHLTWTLCEWYGWKCHLSSQLCAMH